MVDITFEKIIIKIKKHVHYNFLFDKIVKKIFVQLLYELFTLICNKRLCLFIKKIAHTVKM